MGRTPPIRGSGLVCSALSLYLTGLKGRESLYTGCRATLWSPGHCCPLGSLHKPTPQAPSCHLANPSKTTPASTPHLLPLLLKLPEPGNLLVPLLFSHGHLPLVLGYELSLGLLSFPAI